jgi:hypothetical protein
MMMIQVLTMRIRSEPTENAGRQERIGVGVRESSQT